VRVIHSPTWARNGGLVYAELAFDSRLNNYDSAMFNYEQINRLQKNSEDNPLTPARYRQFVRHFPGNPGKVLDVGFNNGRGSVVKKEMLGNNLKLYGVDCVRERIEQIPAGIYESVFYGLADKIPLADRSVDVVVAGFSRVRLHGSGRAASYLGEKFPLLFPYGIYLVSADKQ